MPLDKGAVNGAIKPLSSTNGKLKHNVLDSVATRGCRGLLGETVWNIQEEGSCRVSNQPHRDATVVLIVRRGLD